MAWYEDIELYYKGRLIFFTERYGRFQGNLRVVKGKPLTFSDEDISRIQELSDRKKAKDPDRNWHPCFDCPHRNW